MESERSHINRWLAAIPAILLLTFANVLIGFTVSGVALIQLLASGYNKYFALLVAILVAIAVHLYIIFNHKIRAYIKIQGDSK